MSSEATNMAEAPETTRDLILGGRVSLLQPKAGPRMAIDALFLAAAVPVLEEAEERVLDVGTGTGGAALALCWRVPDVHVTGIDVQPQLIEIAKQNSLNNEMEDRLGFHKMDIMADESSRGTACTERESFHHVAANPPYFSSGSIRQSANAATVRSYSAQPGDLGKWVSFLASMAMPGGTATVINRAEALNELLAHMGDWFGGLTVFPLFPREGAASKRVVVQGIKGSRAPLRLLPGLVLHEADGGYTKAADAVLRNAAPIDLA